MTEGESSYVDKKHEQKKVKRSFVLYNVGIFCCWSAYGSLYNIQSSINIENALGTTAFAVSYFVQTLCSVTLAPIMLRKLGAKVCLVIGDFANFLFILANIYPKYYTLLPASMLMLVLQCTLWPSMSMVNVLYAKLYSAVSKQKKEHHTITFSGYFYTTYHSSQVFGNMMSYVVLYGLNPVTTSTSSSNCTMAMNDTCQINGTRDYQYCGMNDCQDATVIQESINQYKPVNQISLYVLIALSFCLLSIATAVHMLCIPSDASFKEKTKSLQTEMSLMVANDGNDIDNVEEDKTDSDNRKEEGVGRFVISTIVGVFHHCLTLKFALLIPISLYNSLAMSFVFAELTRSLTSCVLGVQWVGVCMTFYSIFDATFSWVIGKFGRKIGRIWTFIACLIVESGSYIYFILWSPGPHNLLTIVIVFCTFGMVDGVLQTIINVTHIDFFEANQDTVAVAWNMLITIGYTLGLGTSRYLCVSARVFMNLSFLTVGTAGVVIAEMCNRRDKKKNTKVIKEEHKPETSSTAEDSEPI